MRRWRERKFEQMEQPERFGDLRRVEQRRLMGVIRSQDDSVARARVPNAAELRRWCGG